ncbi:hypothetical protein FEM48_ZijujUnG0114100 [Ziziphus jujuba var. spinosa]|uniref:Serine-threonine/tyrosine-protein kinase catalytic domain-containing protein n=1 Tax=Ziziphus jujuba var. spinosa TaxID=714518 RepID=A0A978U7Z7_ZIZJJ|nr:hypothetical protein FEM48_ZijujUnG0114100 [Ziziphus jujuba var. spinosa]
MGWKRWKRGGRGGNGRYLTSNLLNGTIPDWLIQQKDKLGYMAPEYALWGYLTYKADIYSYGVVALEIVAGKNNMKYRPSENYAGLVDWALVLQQKGDLMDLVDPRLGSDFNKEEVVRLIKVALLCTNPSPALRPTMSAVLSMLEGRTIVPELIMDPSIYGDQLRLAAVRQHLDEIVQQGQSEESQSLIPSSRMNSSATQTSQDLYQISLNYSQSLS